MGPQNALIPELSVTDLSKSIYFYCDVIGFNLEYSRPAEGFAFLSYGGSQLMLDQIDLGRTWQTAEFEKPLGRGINFQIRTESIEQLQQQLMSANIDLFMEPETKWYEVDGREVGNRQLLVQDPDGYLLRFFEDLGSK